MMIVDKVNQSAMGTQNMMEGRPIWATTSRDRADRGENSRVSKIRRVFHVLFVAFFAYECDYREGSLWVGEELIGSATRQPPPAEVETKSWLTLRSGGSGEAAAKSCCC